VVQGDRFWLLWGIPLALVAVGGGFLIKARHQRQADYDRLYQHWLSAAVGLGPRPAVGPPALDRLKTLWLPIYGLTAGQPDRGEVVGTSALGAQRWISIGGFHVATFGIRKPAQFLLLAGVLSRFPIGRTDRPARLPG